MRRRNFQPMHAFDCQLRTRIIFGADGLASLGDLAVQAGARKTLLVSDRGVIAAGHTQRGIDALRAADIEVTLFEDFGENPTTKDVQRGVEAARGCDPELLVGLGGGSSRVSISCTPMVAPCATIGVSAKRCTQCCR